MPHEQKQIFLTSSPTRWQRFKWGFRILAFIVTLLLVTLGVAVIKEYNPKVPQLRSDNKEYKAIIDNGKSAAIEELYKKYQGFGKYINTKNGELKSIRYVSRADSIHTYAAPIRAAFYDATDY